MSTLITCPHCRSSFALEEVLTEDVQKSLKQQYEQRLRESTEKLRLEKEALQVQQRDFEEKKQRENDLFSERLEKEKQRLSQEIQERTRKSIEGDYHNRMKMLEQTLQDNEEKLRTARGKELEVLALQQKLKEQKDEMDVAFQKRLIEKQQEIEELAIRRAHEAQDLKLKEKEHQIDQMKKLIEEMKRKSEQGSMQLQGEVQEIALEDMLRTAFPYDSLQEVGKGVRGADVIQEVRNHLGQVTGRIVFESKRTQAFSDAWVDKLKSDMRQCNGDLAVIVTQAMPRDMERFGERSGVWICNYSEVISLVQVLRDGLQIGRAHV